MQVIVFVERYEETIMDIEKLNAERQNFMHTAEELSRKGKSLESDLQDLDQELNEDERETARAITEENAHLSEMLDIIYGLINDMERITREQTAQAGL
jgi:predicted RNase H-like nuclease (RuvC/YqgF family)